MRTIESFDINYENEHWEFASGTFVGGEVQLVLNAGLHTRAILLRISGLARTEWTVGRSGSYADEVSYIHDECALWAPTGGNSAEGLPAGEHRFRFNVPLGKDFPYSFEGEYGWIRYYVEAVIDRPWRTNVTTRRAFFVTNVCDLNRYNQASLPQELYDDAMLGCCDEGRVECKVTMLKSGFVTGESIEVRTHVKNSSSTDMKGIVVRLVQLVIYDAPCCGRKTSSTSTVAELRDECVFPAATELSHVSKVVVPSDVPPMLVNFSYKSIIKVLYSVKISLGSSTLEVTCLPILIGTVPLRTLARAAVIETQPTSIVSEPIWPTVYPQSPFPNEPPPSYEECVPGAINVLAPPANELTAGNSAVRRTSVDYISDGLDD